jgi:hypothetical protein
MAYQLLFQKPFQFEMIYPAAKIDQGRQIFPRKLPSGFLKQDHCLPFDGSAKNFQKVY